MRLKDTAQGLALSLAALFFCLLTAEGLLRLLPVNEGLRAQAVNAENPVLRFAPNRDPIWSRFPDFSMQNRVHVNNAGFVNNQNYDPAAPGPLLAVVGDSFVEALMAPWAETLHGRLARELQGRARVYSFAASGAALSQYVAYARHARDCYRPHKGLVVVVGNDFDESLPEYKDAPGLHVFGKGPDGAPVLLRADYAPGLATRLARHSRLALYLANNLEAGSLPQRVRAMLSPQQPVHVGQTAAQAGEQRLADSRWAVDAFLALLPEAFGLPPQDILLVVDAPRPEVYDQAVLDAARASYFSRMRAYLLAQAQAAGLRVVDLEPTFGRDFAARGARFEFPRDGHWNALGHGVAAQAVLDSGFLDGWR